MSLTSRLLLGSLAALALTLLAACSTSSTSGSSASGTRYTSAQRLNPNHPALATRRAQIQAEPRGDFYIGRRYFLDGTRFWGFIRKPGQPWEDAKLVVMNETVKHTPDRLDRDAGGRPHGFDHNYEYRLQGRFTGERVYDPNSNQILPEFLLQNYEVISTNPGFLFHPEQTFAERQLPMIPRY